MNVFQFFIICERTNNANNATFYVKLGKKRRESSKRNYYIISPRVIIKAIIINQMTLRTFQTAPQWLSERRISAWWTPLSESSELERKSSICIHVKQIRTDPTTSSPHEVAHLMESLHGLIDEIQRQHSPELRSFAVNEVNLTGYTHCNKIAVWQWWWEMDHHQVQRVAHTWRNGLIKNSRWLRKPITYTSQKRVSIPFTIRVVP